LTAFTPARDTPRDTCQIEHRLQIAVSGTPTGRADPKT
jgi:hypothetical protein